MIEINKFREWLGNHLYFLPDTLLYKKLRGLPVIKTDIEDAQAIITGALHQEIPVLIARIGGNELDFVYKYGLKGEEPNKYLMRKLKVTAGVFDIEKLYTKEYLKTEYLNSISNIDVLVSWRKEERYFNLKSKPKVGLSDLELFRSISPFTKELIGVILVVSPFSRTIQIQIEKARQSKSGTTYKLFNLDKVEFVFVKPLQTHGYCNTEGVDTWKAALDFQKEKIANMAFDIALLSCGSYGLPLGSYIKDNLGRKAIVVGGVLQLYFDIIGKRWENNTRVMKSLDQKSLVRPSLQEVPKNHSDIESSSYY